MCEYRHQWETLDQSNVSNVQANATDILWLELRRMQNIPVILAKHVCKNPKIEPKKVPPAPLLYKLTPQRLSKNPKKISV